MDNLELKENIQRNLEKSINDLVYTITDLMKLKIDEKYGSIADSNVIDYASIFNEVVNENITDKIYSQQDVIIDFVKDYVDEYNHPEPFNDHDSFNSIYGESKEQKAAKLRKIVESKRKSKNSKWIPVDFFFFSDL